MSHTVNNTGIQLPLGNALMNSDSDSDSEKKLLYPLLDRVPQPPAQKCICSGRCTGCMLPYWKHLEEWLYFKTFDDFCPKCRAIRRSKVRCCLFCGTKYPIVSWFQRLEQFEPILLKSYLKIIDVGKATCKID